jgi:hypothetical protein
MHTQTPSGAGPYSYTKAPTGADASSLSGEALLYPALSPLAPLTEVLA